MSAWQSQFSQPYGQTTSAHERASLNLSLTNAVSGRRKRMSDQAMNERPAEQSQVVMVETALPSSTPVVRQNVTN
jgi:hypothetical protein